MTDPPGEPLPDGGTPRLPLKKIHVIKVEDGYCATIWPPNHGYVSADGGTTSIVFALSDCLSEIGNVDQFGTITHVTSNELDLSPGDGHTCNDIEILSNSSVALRGERDGNGEGRVYTIYADVLQGQQSLTVEFKIQVPHDLSTPAVDSAPLYCVGNPQSTCGSIPGSNCN